VASGLVEGAAVAIGLGLSAYAVLGGADFGGGVWDAIARGPRREQQRRAIADAMGPVWEANHVWLIFVVVILFSAFPRLFSALFTALYVPIGIALIGIVMRGAAFVFRNYSRDAEGAYRAWGAVFSTSSIVTPFLLGACAGVVASGGVRRSADGAVSIVGAGTWLGAFPFVCGAFAVASCAYLAAVYLTVETSGQLREDFRARALVAAAAVGVLGGLGLVLAHARAEHVADGLLGGRATPLTVAAVLTAPLSFWATWNGRVLLARALTAALVLEVLWGWALAQWPYALVPDLTFAQAAAPSSSLRVTLIAVGAGSVLLVPALWLLFSVFKLGAQGTSDPEGVRPS
jgi:cytochrome bd ubiquinol oxidase subunit II